MNQTEFNYIDDMNERYFIESNSKKCFCETKKKKLKVLMYDFYLL